MPALGHVYWREAIRLESKKTIDMVQFVDAEQIDPRFRKSVRILAWSQVFAGGKRLI
jgi:hypothetical protein